MTNYPGGSRAASAGVGLRLRRDDKEGDSAFGLSTHSQELAGAGGTPPLRVTYIVAPICQGTNSLSPKPWASLLVSSPEAMRRQRSKMRPL